MYFIKKIFIKIRKSKSEKELKDENKKNQFEGIKIKNSIYLNNQSENFNNTFYNGIKNIITIQLSDNNFSNDNEKIYNFRCKS